MTDVKQNLSNAQIILVAADRVRMPMPLLVRSGMRGPGKGRALIATAR
jgi:hypothetical protein